MKIKKNDTILIISGKDKGKKGKVIESSPKEGRIVVEGLNMRKKNVRPKKSGEKGQIISLPFPFNVSNAMLICPKCNEATRVGSKIEGGKKFRMCKKCKQEI